MGCGTIDVEVFTWGIKMLNWALKYRRMGLSIIPLKPKGKEPLINWQDFQTRRATEVEIRKWYVNAPNANIGIVTGKLSGITAIDLDGALGLETGLKLALVSSTISLTGTGKHLWYKNQGGLGNSVKRLPGLDIRAEGGYVLAPPSVHPNGKRYRWLKDLRDVSTLPAFPLSLLMGLEQKQSPTNSKEEGWIAQALEDMKDGNIDNTLTSILGRMRRDGWNARDSLALLRPHAVKAGAEDGHLETKIENIWNRYKSEINTIPGWDNGMGNQIIIHSPSNSDSIKQFEQRSIQYENSDLRFNTGFRKLDSMLTGGLKSSRLFTVAARTGVGKTNWLLATIKSLCRAGKRVLLFSTEMPYEEIWQRYINTLKNPEEFREHQFYVCDSFSPNLEKIEEAINEIKPEVFMFDHINHVAEDPRELGTFMQGLNFLRRKYECAGIVSAQLNRSADWVDLKTGEKVTPRMSMIKGSGTIEQASSRVLLLSEVRVTPECTEIVGNLDKNDNGAKGLIHFGLYQNPWRIEELK